MLKNWKEELKPYCEFLRIKKIGNFYYAYARWTEYDRQKERYLGRCDPDGNKISKRTLIRKKSV